MTTKQSFLYRVIAVNTLDADTHRIWFWLREPKDLGFNIKDGGTTMQIDLRVLGIDLPEKHSEIAKEREACAAATAFARSKVHGWADSDSGTLTLRSDKWDKYGGRIDGDLLFRAVTETAGVAIEFSTMMLLVGARPYSGGHKEPWTEAELDRILEQCK